MCGRYSTAGIDREALAERFAIHNEVPPVPMSNNIKPTQAAPVVVQRDGVDELSLMRWGLIPSWAKDPAIGARMFNARAETLAEKPSFKHAFRKKRCLVPATGFYEWKSEARGKVPYLFSLKDGSIFTFAGLYSTWRAPDGEEVATYTIITTTPNEIVGQVHDRMPVILPRDAERLWLDETLDDPHALQSLLVPFDAAQMAMTPVTNRL